MAVYKKHPGEYLNTIHGRHTMKTIFMTGKYINPHDTNSFTCFMISRDFYNNELYIAFRGSVESDDWWKNVTFFPLQDESYGSGLFHSGFHAKANNVNLNDFLEIISKLRPRRVIITGHSMGGAVSSLFYLKMKMQQLAQQQKEQNLPMLINITFGAPTFTDIEAEEFARNNGFDHNMFHIVNPPDIVPSSVLIGKYLALLVAPIEFNRILNWDTNVPLGNFIFLEAENVARSFNYGNEHDKATLMSRLKTNKLSNLRTHVCSAIRTQIQ